MNRFADFAVTIEPFRQRYSIKRFDPQGKLSREQSQFVLEAFHLAPSSVNVQGWQLLVVEGEAVKRQVASTTTLTNPPRIIEASHVLIFCRKKAGAQHMGRVIASTPTFTQMLAKFEQKRGATFARRAQKLLQYLPLLRGRGWLDKQLYLAFGFVMAACAASGIASLPMEGFRPRRLAKILRAHGLPRSVQPVLLLALGYAHPEDPNTPQQTPKGRLPQEEVIRFLG